MRSWRCARLSNPHYSKAGNGRAPIGLERMLRMCFVQHGFNLADQTCEEALFDSTALRRLVGIDLGRERVPDGTTLLKLRRLLVTLADRAMEARWRMTQDRPQRSHCSALDAGSAWRIHP